MPTYLTDQSSMSPQHPTRHASRRRYAVPDPADRAACARFRMRGRKGSRGPAPFPRLSECHSTIAELQETVLELSSQLNRLYETVLQQAIVFRDHLSSCNIMMHDTTHIIPVTALNISPFPELSLITRHSLSLPTFCPALPLSRAHILVRFPTPATRHHQRNQTIRQVMLLSLLDLRAKFFVFAHPSSFIDITNDVP